MYYLLCITLSRPIRKDRMGWWTGGRLCIFMEHINLISRMENAGKRDVERDVAQWLERGALPMLLPAVWFRIPLGAGFAEKYHVSPLSILGHYFDVVSLGKILYPHMLHLIQVKMSTW